MDIGTGILIGCTSLGGFATLIKLAEKKHDYVSKEVCDERSKSVELIRKEVSEGFKQVNDSISRLHIRVDELIKNNHGRTGDSKSRS